MRLLLILALVLSQGPSHQQPQPEKANANDGGRGTEKAPLVVKEDSAERAQVAAEHQQERLDKQTTDRAVVRYTKYLFFATLGLAVFTTLLWRATWNLVTGAETTARHQLRAYVSIKGLGLGPDRWDRFGIQLRNFGQTPAFVQSITMSRKILPFPLPDDYAFVDDIDPDPTPRTVLNPGQKFPVHCSEFDPMFDSVRDDIIKKTLINGARTALYCYGTVRLKDVFGASRWARYCLIFGGHFPFGPKRWSLSRRHNDTSEGPG